MSKYTELSDFEINKKVAITFHKNSDFIEQYDNKTIYVDGNVFDPCNNPTDAWQLILGAKLSIHPDFNNDCNSWIIRNVHIPMVNETNLARGISIAYLLMKDVENEG